jgi:drug/metabolite transporter (DMT)-like permease
MLDALLLLMVFIWGANFSVIKVALRDFPALAFNALRIVLAASLFFTAMAWQRGRDGTYTGIRREDWGRVALLGLLGHAFYQLFFLFGVAWTSVANASLIFGVTPIAVALLSSLAGHERIPWPRWAGAALSLCGLYFVVGAGAGLSVNSLAGDALVFVAMLCWSSYTVVSMPMLRKYSPLVLNGWSMAVGGVLYLVASVPTMIATDWSRVSWASWGLMLWSAVFALCIAYVIWYTGVQRIGSSRTSIYSNLTPVFAMLVAMLWIGEPVVRSQVIGAVAIIGGIFVTRIPTRPAVADRASAPRRG